MYICICNAIRECELREAARSCCSSGTEALYAAMGHEPLCRQCLNDADHVIADERASVKPPERVAA